MVIAGYCVIYEVPERTWTEDFGLNNVWPCVKPAAALGVGSTINIRGVLFFAKFCKLRPYLLAEYSGPK